MPEFIVSYERIFPQPDGTVIMHVRNCDLNINIGDKFGGKTIIRLEAYRKELDFFSPGLTGSVTLDGMPMLSVHKS